MSSSLVTVIIPAKDRPYLVRKAISSVLNQSVSVQIIVIDDGSKTSLKNRLSSRFPMVKFIRNPHPRGPATARNQGIKFASGKYIAFLDSDDTWKKDFLKISINVLKKNPQVTGTISLSVKNYPNNLKVSQKIKLILFNQVKDFLLLLNRHQGVPTAAAFLTQVSHMLFVKNKLKKTKFDTEMYYCEDWGFVLKILSTGSIKIIPQKLVCFNYSISSLSFNYKAKNKKPYYLKHLSRLKKLYPRSFYTRLFNVYLHYFLIGKK